MSSTRLRPLIQAWWIAAACLLTLASPVQAASGGELKRLCTGAPGTQDHNLCTGYVLGVVSTMRHVNNSKLSAKPMACLPASMRSDDMVTITARYLRENPLLMDRDAAELVAKAFGIAYPCS